MGRRPATAATGHEPREPRLRPWPVVGRGLAFGLVALLPIGVIALSIGNDGPEFLGVTAGLALVAAVCLLPMGGFYAWCCGADLRRCRDWRTLTAGHDAVCVAAPMMLRLGSLGLAVFAGSLALLTVSDLF